MVMIKTTGGIIQGVKEEREGILDASSFGKTSMMTNDDVSFSEMGEGEEALNLNI